MKKLLALTKIEDAAAASSIARYYAITTVACTTAAEVAALIGPYSAVIVPYTAQMLISEAVIDAAPQLELIASTYGGARQNIADLYALSKGIAIIHTGASRERPMAEYTLGLILSSLLRIHNYHHDMCSGEEWPRFKYPRTRILHRRKVAVIGYGRIGKAIAELLRCFTPDLAVVSKHLSAEAADQAGLRLLTLDEACRQSEILVLAGGNTAETFHLLGRRQFELMPDNALFVNIARGAMVDQQAMLEVAAARKIFLALDVFETEPLEADSPLRSMPNVLITPHRANNAIEFEERWQCLALDIERFASGQLPDSALTPERARVMSES
ncbi:MAG: glyoxylate reductase [Oligosphaeraceae bacterium]|nr:glyoxylate reductase [Oligosphaeraceae bacterium]